MCNMVWIRGFLNNYSNISTLVSTNEIDLYFSFFIGPGFMLRWCFFSCFTASRQLLQKSVHKTQLPNYMYGNSASHALCVTVMFSYNVMLIFWKISMLAAFFTSLGCQLPSVSFSLQEALGFSCLSAFLSFPPASRLTTTLLPAAGSGHDGAGN